MLEALFFTVTFVLHRPGSLSWHGKLSPLNVNVWLPAAMLAVVFVILVTRGKFAIVLKYSRTFW